MKFAKVAAFSVASVLLLSGCTNASGSADLGATQDIKDAVLTNRSGDCAGYSINYKTAVKDVQRDVSFSATVTLSGDGTKCTITSNDIPNYDFNDGSGHFAESASVQDLKLSITRNPEKADTATDLSLLYYSAVMLNGVVLDQVANGCYKPEDPSADSDGNIANGCGASADWRLDPLGKVKLGTDSHNAHVQPGGLYHYHGDPRALYDLDNSNKPSPVIGFAADGFPIYGPYYLDEKTGQVAQATSGYSIKSGQRPSGDSNPGGNYDGTYIQDYEFSNVGTLDRCNGMTINGQYGYYVTTSYPYVMGCYSGTPDMTFNKFESALNLAGLAFAVIGTMLIVLAVFIIRRKRKKENND